MEENKQDKDVIFTTPAEEEEGEPAERAGEPDGAQAPAASPVWADSTEEEPDLRYRNGKEVVKGGVLGFFIGLALKSASGFCFPLHWGWSSALYWVSLPFKG